MFHFLFSFLYRIKIKIDWNLSKKKKKNNRYQALGWLIFFQIEGEEGDEEEQGRIHGYSSRMRVGRSSARGH